MTKLKSFSKPIVGWVMYDFANSSFATSIVTVLFSVYFVQALVPAGGVSIASFHIPPESLWSYLVTCVMACVICSAPILGALADHHGTKRNFLMFFTIIGGIGTIALFWAKPGHLGYGFLVGFIAFLAYELCLVFYNAFLKDVTTPEYSGRVSGWGFAWGYIGGGTCLALNLWMLSKPATFGLDGAIPALPVRSAFVVVGLWWLIFSIPTFLWVRDKPVPARSAKRLKVVISESMTQLKGTLKHVRDMKDLKRFLIAYFIYNDGIQTLLVMSSIIGAKIAGMETAQLTLCFLMIQFVAFIGAPLFGFLADKWSHKKAVLVTLVVYSLTTIWAALLRNQWEFWILGAVVGLVLGGSQSATRSLYSNLIPANKSGEFFSFYAMVGKAAALMGPLVFGVAIQVFGLRAGIASLVLFYGVGGFLLLGVDEKRGMAEASSS